MSVKNYGLISSIEELGEYFERLIEEQKPVGFDIETGYYGPPVKKGSVRVETNLIAGFSFTNSQLWARYAALNHDMADNLDNLKAAKLLWSLMNSGLVVAHNAAFELRNMARFFREQLSEDPIFGAAVRKTKGYFKVLSDTWIESFLIGEEKAHGLKALVESLFGHKMIKIEELFDLPASKMNTLRFNELELEPKVVDYACEDALWCLTVHEHYYPRLVDKFLYKVDMELMYVLCDMEDFGLKFDWELFRRTREQVEIFIEKINAEIQEDLSEMVGEPININLGSSHQLSDVLYAKLGMSTTRMTKGSKESGAQKMSTDAIALEALSRQYPVVKKIHEWKGLRKLLTSYLAKYEKEYGYAPDGMVHPGLNQAFVVTGRFSASDPNYQQCLPGSYQVLTPTGWTSLDSVRDGEVVAQYLPNGALEFVSTSEVSRYDYSGDMIVLEGGHLGSWKYTPNHRLPYFTRDRKSGGYHTVKIMSAADWQAKLLSKQEQNYGNSFGRSIEHYVARAGAVGSGRVLSEQERNSLRLAVACQADGSHTKGRQYDISVYKARKVSRLRELGLHPAKFADRYRVRIQDSVVSEWLDDTKNFKFSEIVSLSYEDLRMFISEIMLWDGDFTREASYKQAAEREASVHTVQAAAAMCGFSTSLYRKENYLAVNLSDRAIRHSGVQRASTALNVSGRVYCVTVPSGMFLCRNSDGVVAITGNSPKDGIEEFLDAAGILNRKSGEKTGRTYSHWYELRTGESFKFNFRDGIIAPDDFYILGFDLSQAELRAIAGEAGEKALLDAFEAGIDVHSATAALMLRKDISEVTKEDRAIGKTCNFALLYGMGAKSLADRLAISVQEAEELFDLYFSAYPNIKVWVDRQIEFGRKNGYALTKFGRRCPIWAYESDQHWIRSGGDRNAFNYPIQGAATGDYPRIAMVRVHKAIAAAGLADKIKLVMNVHDALEFYVHRSVDLKTAINIIRPAVVFPVAGWPNMVADWHIGQKWGSVKDIVLKDDGSIVTKKGELLAPPGLEEISISKAEPKAVEVIEIPTVGPEQEPAISLMVELADLPDTDSYKRFIGLLRDNVGANRIVLKTPQGDVELPITTSLGTESQAKISLALGGARVYSQVGDIDPSDIFAGMVL